MSDQNATEKLRYSITINASRDKVWQALFEDESFRRWTSLFAEGSYFVGDWSEGSEIRFLNAGNDGMISMIDANRTHEFMSIRHLGYIVNGVEDTDSDEVKSWTPAFENYTLKDVEGGTHLTVETDTFNDYVEYFNETWPKGLDEIKRIAEG
ncbi:MAG: SRPBCC domain-containing protein [Gemmatimonadetes bacterium]|nr:SRPBCC domain-containing protein [Gemmatimonadota bacterium]MYB60403.1 SRPBCC domain-containing protein [Gemmatimonadota bacterium]